MSFLQKIKDFFKKIFKKSKSGSITPPNESITPTIGEEQLEIKEGKKEILEEEKLKEKEIKEQKIKEYKEKKKKKPFIRKLPPDLGVEKIDSKGKTIEGRKEDKIIKKDLGRITSESRKPKKEKIPYRVKSKEKLKKFSTKIYSPFIELNFSKIGIYLIIPRQIFRSDTLLDSVIYQIKINNENKKREINAKSLNNGIFEVEKLELELEEPLLNLEIKYPDEFKDAKYIFSYNHLDPRLYIFSGRYQNRAKMIELWDANGNFNLIPKKKLWILHSDKYELELEPSFSEDLWIWDYDYPKFLDLKKKSYISLRNKATNERKKFFCDTSFYLEGKQAPSDDYDDEFPLFTGEQIFINSLRSNPKGWVVWLQPHNDEIESFIIDDNWNGEEPIILKCPEDLGIQEGGSFQIDICTKGTRIAVHQPLFFRYIPFFECKYPRELIVPTQNGHKDELIDVILDESIDNWNIITQSNIQIKTFTQNNQYQVIVPNNQDKISFSLAKNESLMKNINFEITIPRLRWRIGNQNNWTDKIQQIKRDSLNLGIEIPLEVNTNDYNNSYKIITKLYSNEGEESLQETVLNVKSNYHRCYLNQFFDTILTNYSQLTLTLNIENRANGNTYVVKYLEFSERDPIKRFYQYLLKFKGDDQKDFISYYQNYCAEYNNNKKLRLTDLFEVLKFSFNSSESLKNPGRIFRLISLINKDFRNKFINSLPGLFKNVILDLGTSGFEVKNRVDYLEFLIDFEEFFDLTPPTSKETLKLILKKGIDRINNNYLYYQRVKNIFKPEITNLDKILIQNFKNQIIRAKKMLKNAKEILRDNQFFAFCNVCYQSAFSMLRAYLFFEDNFPLNKPNLTINQMYIIAFQEELGKYLDNFNRIEANRYKIESKHAFYAYKYAEKIYTNIRNKYGFLKSKEEISEKKVQLEKFEWPFNRSEIPDVIRDFIIKHKEFKKRNQPIQNAIPRGFRKLGIVKLNYRYDKDKIIIYGLMRKTKK